MGDWIWVLLAALILFLGVSIIGDPSTSGLSQSPLKVSTDTAAKAEAQQIAQTSPGGSNGSSSPASAAGTKQEGSKSTTTATTGLAYWVPILLIPALILLGRILMGARNYIKHHRTPHAGSV